MKRILRTARTHITGAARTAVDLFLPTHQPNRGYSPTNFPYPRNVDLELDMIRSKCIL